MPDGIVCTIQIIRRSGYGRYCEVNIGPFVLYGHYPEVHAEVWNSFGMDSNYFWQLPDRRD